MRRVSIITKAKADEIAKNYFENSKAQSLYVTRDGQIFLKGSGSFMKMHENDCKLEASWHYLKDAEVIEPAKSKEKDVQDFNKMSFVALKELANNLTEKGTIEMKDWENLKYQDLKKLLKDK